jgi:hypothetical protein
MNWKPLTDDYRAGAATLQPYRGILRLLRPRALDRDTGREWDALEAANPLTKRFPLGERNRMRAEIAADIESKRREAAAVARYKARTARDAVTRGRDAIARARADVELSMPDARNGISPDGTIALAHYELALTPRLEAASAAEKFAIAQGAYQRKDARGFVEATIIERLIATGAPLARDESELPIVRQLIAYVEGTQDLRIPTSVPDFDALAAEADRLDARADALAIVPLAPETNLSAAQAYNALLAEMNAAGEKSDADDHAAVRSELAAS